MIIILVLTLTAIVYGRRCCSRNANLMKSIQYQLKLVEQNDGTCDRDHKRHGSVGFMVTNSKHLENIPQGGAIIYDKVITNVGGGYSKVNGIFTAPIEGLYSFSWTSLPNVGTDFDTDMFLNGKLVARNLARSNGLKQYIAGTQNAVVYMKKEDKISIKNIYGGKLLHNNYWSTFSGYLI